MMKHRRSAILLPICIFKSPTPVIRIMSQARVVVTLVEKLEHAGEDLGLLVWEVDTSAWGMRGMRDWCCIVLDLSGEEA